MAEIRKNKIAFKSKANHPTTCYFCLCDLDVDPIYEAKVYFWKMYLHTKNKLSKVIVCQTNKHAD